MCGLIISSPLVDLLLLQYRRQIIPPHRLTNYKLFRISKMEEFTYEQIRAKALKQGVKEEASAWNARLQNSRREA